MFICVVSKMYLYFDHAKGHRAVMKEEEAAQPQNAFHTLWTWTQGSLLKFNLSKSHQLWLEGTTHRAARIYINGSGNPLASVDCEKDLGVSVDPSGSFKDHIAQKVMKVDSLFAINNEALSNIAKQSLRTFYRTLARPNQENAQQTWKTHLKKYKILIENIQRRATKLIPQ